VTSRRVMGWLGTLLVVAGVVVVGVVAYTYFKGHNSATPPSTRSTVPNTNAQINRQNRHFLHVSVHHGLQLGQAAVRMRIPAIGVDSPVIETGVVNGQWQVADWAIGHLQGTANPGMAGNVGLAAHDDIKGEIFKRLGELRFGERVYVYTRRAVYTYAVTGKQVVPYRDGAVLNPQGRKKLLTMITCTPYWVDSQRLVVFAVMKGVRPLPTTSSYG